MQNPMMKTVLSRRNFLTINAVVFCLALTVSNGAAAVSPKVFVEKVGNQVIAAARAGSAKKFHRLLTANAAISTIAAFSLGPYRKKLPASRKKEFHRLVAKHISKIFAAHSKKLAGKNLKVLSSRPKGKSTIVKSVLKYPSGQSAKVTWRLVNRGGSYKIFDVNVKGIWLANIQKTDFTGVMRRNNGNIEALFNYLKR